MGPLPIVLPLAMAVVVVLHAVEALAAAPAGGRRRRSISRLTLSILAAAGLGRRRRVAARSTAPGRLLLGLVSLLFLCCAIYSVGYLRYASSAPNRCFCACLLVVLGDHEPGRLVAAPGPDVGRDGGDDAGHGAADLLQPFAALDRGDLEVPADRSVGIALALLGSFFLAYACAARGRTTPRCSRRPARRGADAVAALAARRRSSCCWSATAPRWAWPPCTPGSPTRTARRPAWSARCWRAASPVAPSWPCASHQITAAAGEGDFARAARLHRARVDGWAAVSRAPARLQADARLLERRAHGHPGARRGPRRARRLRHACCTWSTTG